MSLKVLVVDDSAIMRRMLAKVIEMCGLNVDQIIGAGTGEEGLEILNRGRIDIVLIDINMPIMGGMEMISRMAEVPGLSSIPIVIVSTESSTARVKEAIGKGVSFIHKPFTPEQIRSVIVKLMGGVEGSQVNVAPGGF